MKMVTWDAMALLHSTHSTAYMPSTVIHSVKWAACNHVQQLPSVSYESTVNHSGTFFNLDIGKHTENKKYYWRKENKNLKGIHEEILSLYLDASMSYEHHGQIPVVLQCVP